MAIEIFQLTAAEAAGQDEELVYQYSKRPEFRLAHMNGQVREAMLDAIVEEEGITGGWFWWNCFPGCLPDSPAYGPFATRAEAEADAEAATAESDLAQWRDGWREQGRFDRKRGVDRRDEMVGSPCSVPYEEGWWSAGDPASAQPTVEERLVAAEETPEETASPHLRQICDRCGCTYGEHREIDDACPDTDVEGRFDAHSRFKPEEDEFTPEETPAPITSEQEDAIIDRFDALLDHLATEDDPTQELASALVALAKLHPAEFARLLKAEEDDTRSLG